MELILIKQFFYKFIIRYAPELLFKFQHYGLHKKFIRKSSFLKSNAYVPNLNNPKTFNEYILSSKNNTHISNYYKFVDKFLVKDYVRNIIDEKHIIPTQNYYTSEQKINIDDFSFPCIIKPTHLSGYLLRLNDKSDFNKKSIEKFHKLTSKINFYNLTGEIVYKNFIPGLIVEPLLDKIGLHDYKFFCFNGNPLFVQVDTDRFGKHERTMFSIKWEKLDFQIKYKESKNPINCPDNFEQMIEIVKNLSKSFNFVRVDLYNKDGHIYFGELTFSPGSGYEPFSDYKYDAYYGKLLNK